MNSIGKPIRNLLITKQLLLRPIATYIYIEQDIEVLKGAEEKIKHVNANGYE